MAIIDWMNFHDRLATNDDRVFRLCFIHVQDCHPCENAEKNRDNLSFCVTFLLKFCYNKFCRHLFFFFNIYIFLHPSGRSNKFLGSGLWAFVP